MTGIVTTTAAAAIEPIGSVNCEAPGKAAIAAGTVSAAVGRGQRRREHEVVPAEQEDEDRRGEDPRRGQRGDHLEERLEGRRAVDLGRLLELPGDLAEERREREDRQGQREGHVGDDQPGPGVIEADVAPEVVERADERDRREHGDAQRRGEDDVLAREVQPRDRVGGEAGQDHGEHGRDEGDPDRVAQGVGEDRLVEDAAVVGPRPLAGEEGAVGDRGRVLEGQRDDPHTGTSENDDDRTIAADQPNRWPGVRCHGQSPPPGARRPRRP